jgi:arylsulfatase A
MRVFPCVVLSAVAVFQIEQAAAQKQEKGDPVAEAAGQLPAGALEFPELELQFGTAYRHETSVVIVLESLPNGHQLIVPRMANVVERIRWIGGDATATMTLKPEINHWVVRLSPPPAGEKKLLVLDLDSSPKTFNDNVVAVENKDGVISLPAKFATVHGEKLRFEPQPHKNTVGYWAVEKDFAEWHCNVSHAGWFDVEILQGCGQGHGGSDVELRVADQRLSFKVQETGHFQNFRWRHLGQVQLQAADDVLLQLIPLKKVAGAVMDCREIRLVPVKNNDVSLRRTGLNVDGGRADSRTVQNKRPNVLVILTDDQGTLDAGCYGSRDLFTPRMDGLANAGVRFTQAYSHMVCCPARAMLMTGRHPQRSGINSWTQGDLNAKRGINMAAGELTIAEVLKAAGYRTALFGKWHLGAADDAGPTTQGFDEFFGHRGGFIDNYNHYFLHGSGFHDLYRGITEVQKRGQYFPDMTVEESRRFLSEHISDHADAPFFLYAAFNIPHYPEQGDSRFDQLYATAKMPRQSYGRMITTVDDRIGQILDELDRLGVRDNTAVIFQSDNGHSAEDYQIKPDKHMSDLPQGHNYGANGGGGNTGKWKGHKATFYEGGLRVPAIVSYPKRLPSREVRDQAITLCDWLPTITELCDVDLPENHVLDGRSLLPIINDNAKSHHSVMHWQWQSKWAVRDGDWKLIGNAKRAPELVNLADREPESINHAKEKPEVVARLQTLYDEWTERVSQR